MSNQPEHSHRPATTQGRTADLTKMARQKGHALARCSPSPGPHSAPIWGYHSSRATAFLMTLFNVRLGAWMPNPARSNMQELALAKPANSLRALFDELLGRTTDTRQAVYLSDGGHFENLGLYEMLRRRCRMIVVVDAGQDQDRSLFDLGNAICKARIDLGADIQMDAMRIRSRKEIEANPAAAAGALGFAVGTINYPEHRHGRLIYLKPSFLPDIPADVRAYGLANALFPHVSTMNSVVHRKRVRKLSRTG